MDLNEKIVSEFFGLLRENTKAVSEVDKKVTVLVDHRTTQEKAFDNYMCKTDKCFDDQSLKIKELVEEISILKLWRSSEAGVTGFIKNYGPILIALAALYYSSKGSFV